MGPTGASGFLSCRFDCFGQLQQVVNGADPVAFAFHFRHATQQELPKPAALFDLTKDRLDHRLAQTVSMRRPARASFVRIADTRVPARPRRWPVALASL